MTLPLSDFQQELATEHNNSATSAQCGATDGTLTCFRPPHAIDVAHAAVQVDGSFVQWADPAAPA